MDIFTWPIAVATVGSIATICLTIIRIWGTKRGFNGSNGSNTLQQRLSRLEQDSAVQRTQIEALHNNVEQLGDHLSKLNDLLIKLLTDNR